MLIVVVVVVIATLITVHRLRIRLIQDLLIDCPPSILSFIYMIFVMPSILYELVVSSKYERVEECNDEILLLSGSEISRRIKDGKITCVKVVDAAIRRLKEVNPQINAVVTFRFEDARLDAKKVDRLLKKKDPFMMNSPLVGVPCVVKVCMEIPGLPYTAGVKSRMNQVGSKYATCICRAMEAGIIILGGTNTSEACMFHESSNTIYGLTRNPYVVYCSLQHALRCQKCSNTSSLVFSNWIDKIRARTQVRFSSNSRR